MLIFLGLEHGKRHDQLPHTIASKRLLSPESRDGCLDWERMSASTDEGRLLEQVLSLQGAPSLQNEKEHSFTGPGIRLR